MTYTMKDYEKEYQAAKKSGYTPVNATSAPGVDYGKYLSEVAKQQEYQAANPTAGQAYTAQEKQEKYGGITDPIYNTGVYTKDRDAAYAAAAQQGTTVTPTRYFNGEDGYYYVGDNKDQRTVQEGASGADEGLMTNQDYAIIQSLKQQYADAQKNYQSAAAAGNTALAEQYQQEMDAAHLEAERIRAGYGYSGGSDGSMYITGGALKKSAGSGGSGTSGGTGNTGSGGTGSTGSGTASDLKSLLDQWKAAAEEQSGLQIDYAVQQAITELERALEDAQDEFKEQQESIYKDEMQSRDNAALYAEARGDKGGIGHDQYTSIMNTAAQNRLSVQQAQTKLATDTQRQIADLRAQGEFEKADALLEISQQYLSQLVSLEQWAAEYDLSVAQFQESIRQWEASFEESVRQFDTNLSYQQYRDSVSDSQWQQQFDYTQSQNNQSQLISTGTALLEAGIMPSSSQLEAMGMTSAQAQSYISAARLAQAYNSGGGNDNGNDGGDDAVVVEDLTRAELYQHLFDEDAFSDARYSAGKTQDADYMSAVKSGDMKTAQQMVDEAARKAGYDTVQLYHGTKAFGFTKFNPKFSDDKISLFASNSLDVAQTYSGTYDVKPTTAKPKQYRAERLTDQQVVDALASVGERLERVTGEQEIQRCVSEAIARNVRSLDKQVKMYNERPGNAEYFVVPHADSRLLHAEMTPERIAEAASRFTEEYLEREWGKNAPGFSTAKTIGSQAALASEGSLFASFDSKGRAVSVRSSDVAAETAAVILNARESNGNYVLYGNSEGLLLIDGKGANWNNLSFRNGGREYTTTRDIVAWAHEHGYAGVKFHNIVDNSAFGRTAGASDVYAFFDGRQLKSAEAVTYDSFGKVIPLSKRFNERKNDIRYSAGKANTDTEAFHQWFHDDSGELTNPDGTPKVFLRGDTFSGATQFYSGAENHSGGIFFSTDPETAEFYSYQYSEKDTGAREFIPSVYDSWTDAFVAVQDGELGQSVTLERSPDGWDLMARCGVEKGRPKYETLGSFQNNAEGLAQFNEQYGRLLGDSGAENPGWMQVYLSAENTLVIDAEDRSWANVDSAGLRINDIARQAWEDGYDMVVVKNVRDGAPTGMEFDENDNYTARLKTIDVYIAKDSSQVKSVYNTGSFDDANPDVRYSTGESSDGDQGFNPDLNYPSWTEQVDAYQNRQLDDLLRKNGDRASVLYVAAEPTALLKKLGLSDLPLIVTRSHMKQIFGQRWGEGGKVINDHNHELSANTVKLLPQLIQHPVLVLKSDPHRTKGGVEIVTNLTDKNNDPIVVTIKPDQQNFTYDGVNGPAHFVNIFGRENFEEHLETAFKRKGVLYINKERADSVQFGASAARHERTYGVDSNVIIQQKDPTVKPAERRFSVGETGDGNTGSAYREYAPTFFSKMEQEIGAFKQAKMGASSVVAYLKGHGVKDAEIRWSGIEQWLDGKKSVTKEELLEFAKLNGVEMEEQVLDGHRETTELMDESTGEIYDDPGHMEDTIRANAEMEGYDPEDVRFDYGNFPDDGMIYAYIYKDGEEIDLTSVQATFSDKNPQWEAYKTPGGDNYRELLYKMPGSEYTNRAMGVHWGNADEGSGVLAHARVQDFETADGPMLFIEEIQSDWHNAGHANGYVTGDVAALQQELRDLRAKDVLSGEKTEAEVAREAELNKMLYPKHAELNARRDALRASLSEDEVLASAVDKIAQAKFEGNRHYAENNIISNRSEQYIDDMVALGVQFTAEERDTLRQFIFDTQEWSQQN